MIENMYTLKKLLIISRPRFWIYVWGPFLLGITPMILEHSSFTSTELWLLVFFCLYFTFPANSLIYGINDIYDIDTDSLNPKKETYETKFVPEDKKILVRFIAITTGLALCVSFLLPLYAIASMLVFIYASVFYSAWPIRAKARPILDSFVSSFIYITPGLFGYYLVGGVEFPLFLISSCICWAMAMHAYSAIPDIGADTESQVKTVATFLGKKHTLVFCAVLYALSGLFGFFTLGWVSIILALIYLGLVYFSYIVKTYDELFYLYTKFPLINTLVGMVLFFFIIFHR